MELRQGRRHSWVLLESSWKLYMGSMSAGHLARPKFTTLVAGVVDKVVASKMRTLQNDSQAAGRLAMLQPHGSVVAAFELMVVAAVIVIVIVIEVVTELKTVLDHMSTVADRLVRASDDTEHLAVE